jgi:hypothetical protein
MWASRTTRSFLADGLSMTDNKGVVFLKQRRLMRQIVFEGGLKAIISATVPRQVW